MEAVSKLDKKYGGSIEFGAFGSGLGAGDYLAFMCLSGNAASIAAQYIIAGALTIAAVGMGIYLAVKGKDLTRNERWGIILSIPVWLILAYVFYR